jgi:hypothetical protein
MMMLTQYDRQQKRNSILLTVLRVLVAFVKHATYSHEFNYLLRADLFFKSSKKASELRIHFDTVTVHMYRNKQKIRNAVHFPNLWTQDSYWTQPYSQKYVK